MAKKNSLRHSGHLNITRLFLTNGIQALPLVKDKLRKSPDHTVKACGYITELHKQAVLSFKWFLFNLVLPSSTLSPYCFLTFSICAISVAFLWVSYQGHDISFFCQPVLFVTVSFSPFSVNHLLLFSAYLHLSGHILCQTFAREGYQRTFIFQLFLMYYFICCP